MASSSSSSSAHSPMISEGLGEAESAPIRGSSSSSNTSENNNSVNGVVAVVTGGRGFVGRHVVRGLLQLRSYNVRIVDLSPSLVLDGDDDAVLKDAVQSGRAVYYHTDVTNKGDIIKACQGASVVFHMAAPNPSVDDFGLHYRVTVQGTRNVIDACLECDIKRLIYTSSARVVFDGIHDIRDGDESLPYPDKYNSIYSEMKAQAEAMVLQSHDREGLITCVLRPGTVFGPGDKLLIPSLVSYSKSSKLKLIVGDGKNMNDFTYVENVAHAHICAEKALHHSSSAGGKAYFITDMKPLRFWDFVSLMLEGLGYQRPSICVPEKLAIMVVNAMDWKHKITGSSQVSQMKESRIRLISRTRTFSCSRAQKYIGYSPVVTLEDGIKKTLESFRHLQCETPVISSSREMNRYSKAHKFLGGGKVADILVWRNDKQTFIIAMMIAFLIHHFILTGYTFMHAVARLLFLIASVLFIHGNLPPVMFGYHIEKMPPSAFEVPEETVQKGLQCIRHGWNAGIVMLKDLAKGNDWERFVKTMAFLYLIKCVGSISSTTLIVLGYSFIFTFFCIYENKEEEIDRVASTAIKLITCIKDSLLEKLPRDARVYLQKVL